MKLIATLCTSLLVSLAPLSSNAFQLEHKSGVFTQEHPPSRVVSFDIGYLDTLDALGIDVTAVPQSVYGGSLKRFNEYKVVGTLFEPNYEELQKIKPDLIIAGGRSLNSMPNLDKIAPTVTFEYNPDSFMESLEKSSVDIARAWGKEVNAHHKLITIKENIKTLHELNANKKGAFLFVINGNIIAHAPGDRFGYVYELTGLESVLPKRTEKDLQRARPKPGTPEAKAAAERRASEIELIAKADPDWIIMLDRGAINNGKKTAANTIADHAALSKTSAFKSGNIYYVDPNSWYIVTTGLNNVKSITDDLIHNMQ